MGKGNIYHSQVRLTVSLLFVAIIGHGFQHSLSRRQALATTAATFFTAQTNGVRPPPAIADDDADPTRAVAGTSATIVDPDDTVSFELRDRKANRDSVIREDYWYMMGKTPPRRLLGPLKGDDPQFNAFGACESTVGGGNPCTYVSLQQRIPAYSKYGFPIANGAKEYEKLGQILLPLRRKTDVTASDPVWIDALSYIDVPAEKAVPPAAIDAELKMILFATASLTSPNFPGPSRELLVARYYVNEVHFAARAIRQALQSRDGKAAWQAWLYGRDAWNSYFQVVNRAVVPKVGEKFQPIADPRVAS